MLTRTAAARIQLAVDPVTLQVHHSSLPARQSATAFLHEGAKQGARSSKPQRTFSSAVPISSRSLSSLVCNLSLPQAPVPSRLVPLPHRSHFLRQLFCTSLQAHLLLLSPIHRTVPLAVPNHHFVISDSRFLQRGSNPPSKAHYTSCARLQPWIDGPRGCAGFGIRHQAARAAKVVRQTSNLIGGSDMPKHH